MLKSVCQQTSNHAMKRILGRDLLSLPLQSAALKRRLSRRQTAQPAAYYRQKPDRQSRREN